MACRTTRHRQLQDHALARVSDEKRSDCPEHRRHGSSCSAYCNCIRSLRRQRPFFRACAMLMRTHNGRIDHKCIHCRHGPPVPRKCAASRHSCSSVCGGVWSTRQSPKRSGNSRQAMPARYRYRYSTASTNRRLSFAVLPTCPIRPGSQSLIRSHWSSRNP